MTVTPWQRCYVKDCNQPATEAHEVMHRVRGGDGLEVCVTLHYCRPCFVRALRFKLGRRRAA